MASAHRGPDTTLLIFLLSQSDWNKIAMNSNLNFPETFGSKIKLFWPVCISKEVQKEKKLFPKSCTVKN